jgi:hypothetical protein
MKRFFTLISFVSFSIISATAQEISDGYYRVHTAAGDHYVSLVNNKVDDANLDKVKTGGGASVYSLRLKPLEEVISDPGSILNVKKTDKGYILEGQDANTYNLSSLYLQARNTVDGITAPTGSYFLYGSKDGATRYLFDSGNSYDTDLNAAGEKTKYTFLYCVGKQKSGNYTLTSNNAYWYFDPIDNASSYFGITPETDIKIDGKYYTTIYCTFPFKVTGDMKAYYVTGIKSNSAAAKLVEIEDGIVPAKTAVIIECTSEKAADNKVIVGAKASKTYSSELKGNIFSYVKKSPSDGITENTSASMAELKNVTSYNNSSMRVLGVSKDGKLALVKATDDKLNVTDKGKYIRANKAYAQISSAADVIILGDGEDTITDISSVKNDIESSEIYNLKGQKVNSNADELPHGLYIINGKKIIK